MPMTALWHRLNVAPQSADWQSALLVALVVFVPLRLFMSLFGAVVQVARYGLPPDGSVGGWLAWLLLLPWSQWDTTRYTGIAADGYALPDGRAAFHPLLPILIRVVSTVIGDNYLLSAIIVSNAACVVLLAVFFRVVALDHDTSLAFEATRWVLWNPLGFIFLLPYTESLVLALALLCFWAFRHEWWLQAGLWGLLATLTKQTAIALVVPMALWYLEAHWRHLLRWRTVYVACCIALVPLGYLGFALYRAVLLDELDTRNVFVLWHSIIVSEQLREQWGSRFGAPWEMLASIVQSVGLIEPRLYFIQGLPALVGLVLVLASLRHEKLCINGYSLVSMLLLSSIVQQPALALTSLPRRFLLIFPIFAQLARWTLPADLQRRWFYYLTSWVIMAGYIYMFTAKVVAP